MRTTFRFLGSRFLLPVVLALALLTSLPAFGAADGKKIRILIVGGDWKSQLSNSAPNSTLKAGGPLRGYFIKQEADKAEPGRFDFTLWTSYEFLQYGDAQTLAAYDVVMVGDVMGQSVVPRLATGLDHFVRNGGGFWFCDSYKGFNFYTKENSFDSVLPIETVLLRAYDDPPGNRQPECTEKPLTVQPVGSSPILAGLDLASAPPLLSACYGKVKNGATVLATSPAGVPLWVAWEHDGGRALWTGGLFANDEKSVNFATWPQVGKLYAQAFEWLAAKSHAAAPALAPVTAEGTVTVDLAKKGPALTSKHFGISGTGGDMTPAALALFQDLHLDGSFERSGTGGIKKTAFPGDHCLNDGTDLTTFDWSKYDFSKDDHTRANMGLHKTDFLYGYACPYWVDWEGLTMPEPGGPARYTKYFAAVIQHFNGSPGKDYHPDLTYFEIMSHYFFGPIPNTPVTHAQVFKTYTDFLNYSTTHLSARYPGMKFGAGGMDEVPYLNDLVDACGKNLSWISRHTYGQTGESIFALQDGYARHARKKGIDDLKFIVTEWDFWIYGDPAFDYIMQRWKPLADHADTCIGSLHYCWNEFHETTGDYVYGVIGQFDPAQPYGQLPTEWPHPGVDKPITYRYDAFWAMRNCRGPQFAATVDVPELQPSLSPRAYAIATSDGKQYNVTIYYGYPYGNTASGHNVEKIKLHIKAPIPPGIKGRSLVIERADSHTTSEAPPQTITGDVLDTVIEVPALSAVSLTVR